MVAIFEHIGGVLAEIWFCMFQRATIPDLEDVCNFLQKVLAKNIPDMTSMICLSILFNEEAQSDGL